jgi:hypothetical protein
VKALASTRFRPLARNLAVRSNRDYASALLVLQWLCAIALLVPAFRNARVIIRMACFGGSLALLILVPAGRHRRHPAASFAIASVVILVLSLLHPTINNLLSASAQVALYCAILAPLFWVPRMDVDERMLRRAMRLIWLFSVISAMVGVLQVYYPGQFDPPVSSVLMKRPDYLAGLKIQLATGEYTYRPMGLSDTPGGAAGAGMTAVLFGAWVILTARNGGAKVVAVLGMAVGMVCLFLCQLRSLVVMTGIGVMIIAAVLARRRQLIRLSRYATFFGLVVAASFFWALLIAPDATLHRLQTLVEQDPGKTYYKNRGHFLEYTFTTLLPEYPLGVGPGRWGMMYLYFADKENMAGPELWAEIMWTGWLYDGGVPLILSYSLTIVIATALSWRLATTSRERRGIWVEATVLTAYNVGVIAVTFNSPFFVTQNGLEFWLFNALLYATARRQAQIPHPGVRARTPVMGRRQPVVAPVRMSP